MTLSDSATAQLWETFRAGGGAGLIREAVELVLQELIEAEAAEAIGAGRYERSEHRRTERNGHRGRLLATQAGDVELKIPKLRKGSFFPSMLEPRRRIDKALYAVIMEAYVAGVSTRSVDDLVAALLVRTGGFEPPHPCGYWDLNPARLPDSATSASPLRVARGGGASGRQDWVALRAGCRAVSRRRRTWGPEAVLPLLAV